MAKAERNGAYWLYLLSLCSPLLVVSALGLGPLAFLLPLAILYLLFSGLFSRHAFVRWHAGQWTLLTLLAALVALISLTLYRSDYSAGGGCGGLIAIGGWYIGNLMGLRQASRGECWLWKWIVPSAELPRPWPKPETSAAPTVGVPSTAPNVSSADPQAAIEQGRSLLDQGKRPEAVACFLSAFRDGPPDLRRRALAELDKLGEVETF
jgi:hypothetical protein